MDASVKMKSLLISTYTGMQLETPVEYAEEMFHILTDAYFYVKLFSVK